jgi:hypothetical protein
MPKSLELWALIISILAIGISIITWLKSHNIDRARRDDEERDQNSANLTAHLERHKQSMGKIVIDNIGQSEARNVQVMLDGTPILEHKSIFDPTKSHPVIGASSQIVYKINVAKDLPPPNHIELSWNDNHANGKTYRNSLSY